jgi:hypothetical protein
MRMQGVPGEMSVTMDGARDDLGRLARGLGGLHYPTEKEVSERILAITRLEGSPPT